MGIMKIERMPRQRKVLEPCPICAASRTLCLCDVVPRIALKTKIALVIHHRELSRNSNTGLLALRALVNSAVRIRGERRETLDLKDLLLPQYRTFLFFPSADAVELDAALVAQDPRPIQLIVPDGTWRQARKIQSRHPELKELPRVKISKASHAIFQLRAQSRPERMATLQAIAHALGIIEGDPIQAQLMRLYYIKIERTLAGRGILIEKPALT
jgi:DTW domain-containing protein YfiP